MNADITVAGLTATATVAFDAAHEQAPQPWKVDWGDGTAMAAASGTLSRATTYARDGFYKVIVRANEVAVTQTIRVGNPGFPAWNQHKIRERREAVQEELAGAAGTKGLVG